MRRRVAARGGARRPALTPFPSFETISYFRKTCLSISSDISQVISERPTLLACAAQSAGVPRRAAAGGTAAQLFPRSEAQAASAYPSMWAAERLSVAPPSVHFLFVTASPRCQRHAFKCLDQFSMVSASEFFQFFPEAFPFDEGALDQHPSHGNCARAHASARWVAKPTPERAERPGIRPHGRVPLLLWGTHRRPGSHRLLPSIPKGGKCMWRLLQAGQVQTLALGPRAVPGFRRTQTISARCVRAATAKKRIARGVDTAVVSPCHRIR